jgi:chaperone modulatory protein CbpM
MKTTQPATGAYTGELVEDELLFSVEDLCRNCSLQVDRIIEFVQEGLLEASGEDYALWRFELSSLRRIRTAMRLQRDLGVNLAGAALALELLDRIAALELQAP